MTSGIYRIRNPNSGGSYIGSSCNVERRLVNHRQLLKKGHHHSIHLQRAWNISPRDFEFEILEECERGSLTIREQFYIDTEHPSYNILPQAGNHSPRPEETKKKIGAANHLVALNRPDLRIERSERAKLQHKLGTLGRHLWPVGTEEIVREKLRASWSPKGLRGCVVCGTVGLTVKYMSSYYCLPHDPIPGRNKTRNEGRRQAQLKIINRVVSETTKAKLRASQLGKKHVMTPEGRASLVKSLKARHEKIQKPLEWALSS